MSLQPTPILAPVCLDVQKSETLHIREASGQGAWPGCAVTRPQGQPLAGGSPPSAGPPGPP